MASTTKRFYEFEGFRLEPEKMRLWRNGNEVHITPKALAILILLVQKQGDLVRRDELLESVWKDTFIEEGNINFNISVLRKALQEESGSNTQFIRTIPKQGYRFVPDVHEVFEAQNGNNGIRYSASEPAAFTTARSKSAIRRSFLAIALVGVCFVSLAALWKLGAERGASPVPNQIKSIAILPVKPINESEDANILSISLTDALISRLGRLNRFAIRPLSSVEGFLKEGKDAITFGEELKVDAVLEGTLIDAVDRVRVNFRLVDVRDGRQIWTENFDVNSGDILTTQAMVSSAVARNLIENLNSTEKDLLAKRPTENQEAYGLYLRGRYVWNRRGMWNKGASPIDFFERAIALDPNFAPAYLGLADSHAFTYSTREAEQALKKALELDPTLAEAHATLGFLRMFHYWDWTGAEAAFKKAIELSPNDAKSHHWYGVFFSLMGRFDEAKAEMQIAQELDPVSLIIMADIGQLHYFAREYDKAEQQLDTVIAIDPGFHNANKHQFRTYLMKGQELGALKRFLIGRSFEQTNEDTRNFETGGINGVLRHELKELNCSGFDPYNSITCAEIFHLLGEEEKAFSHLEYCVEKHVFLTPFINVDPLWDDLRQNQRFKRLLSQMNFPVR